MFNQEQLAAIAAAMSVLQHNLQSNNQTPITSNGYHQNNNNHLQTNNQHPLHNANLSNNNNNTILQGDQLNLTDDVDFLPAIARNSLSSPLSSQLHHVKQQQQLQQQHPSQRVMFQQQQQQPSHQDALGQHLFSSPPKQLQDPQLATLLNQFQHHTQFEHQNNPDLNSPTSPPKQPNQLNNNSLADNASALIAALAADSKADLASTLSRASIEEQVHQFRGQFDTMDFLSATGTSAADLVGSANNNFTNNLNNNHNTSNLHLDHNNQPTSLSSQIQAQEQALVNQLLRTHLNDNLNENKHMNTNQHYQQQQNNLLVNQYQSQHQQQYQQRQDLNLVENSVVSSLNNNIITTNNNHSNHKHHQLDLQNHQQAMHTTQQSLQQQPPLQQQQQQQQHLSSMLTQQLPVTNKSSSKPVSYSAIVAKAAGLNSNQNGISNNHNSTSNTNHVLGTGMTSNSNHIMNSNNNLRNLNGHTNTVNNNIGTNHNLVANSQPFTTSNYIGILSDTNNHNNVLNNLSNSSNNMNSLTSTINNINPLTHLSHNNTNNNIMPHHGSATNLLGFMGLYVGNLSPDLTKEQLEKMFSKYGEPVKAHRLIRSPVAFIKYENTESPRLAIDDLYGVLLPELTLNPDQPLKLHFDRNDAQLKANYRPTELPPDADNGECYGWRTTVCRRGKSCPKKHIPINRGIDFQMWMIKSSPPVTATTLN